MARRGALALIVVTMRELSLQKHIDLKEFVTRMVATLHPTGWVTRHFMVLDPILRSILPKR